MAEQTPGLRRQRRMDRQGVGLPQQFLEARGAVDAERQFDTVRQVGIVGIGRKNEPFGDPPEALSSCREQREWGMKVGSSSHA